MNAEGGATGELLLYQSEDGRTRIECRIEDETLWLTQAQIADLFQTRPQNITQHLRAIYAEGELEVEATCKSRLQVRSEGGRQVSRSLRFYNLEVILAVGYRVRSHRGTQFRQWATERLSEYLVKGFALDDQRLKRTDRLTDYFDELLERIRDIRASEARVYQRIREIFALASDYREDDRAAQRFFATMQNKMHFAATGQTAAEIVRTRADASKPNMGLTSWSGSRVLKRDVVTAKNYLDEEEIDTLNRIVVMFLDQAEFRAQRRKDIRMSDWEADLDRFLANTELPVLDSAGSVSQLKATHWAHEQYDAFTDQRRLQAEEAAESRYIEDLKTAAKLLEAQKSSKAKPPKRSKPPPRGK